MALSLCRIAATPDSSCSTWLGLGFALMLGLGLGVGIGIG